MHVRCKNQFSNCRREYKMISNDIKNYECFITRFREVNAKSGGMHLFQGRTQRGGGGGGGQQGQLPPQRKLNLQFLCYYK